MVALGAAAVGILVAKHFAPKPLPPPEIGGYVLPEPRALPAVELVDTDGERFTPADFAGHWSFLYFGYTYCPDVCPLALIELAAVKKLLEAGPAGTAAGVLPRVGRPGPRHAGAAARIRGLLRPLVPWATGSADELRRLAEPTGSLFLIPAGQGTDHYLVSHSSNVTVLDPAGRIAAVITPPHEPSGIAADFARILAYRAARPWRRLRASAR